MAGLPRLRSLAAAAASLTCALATAVRADSPPSLVEPPSLEPPEWVEPAEEPRELHVATIAIEALIVLAIPTAYYWNTTEHQAVDWTLDWDWPSWEAKLLSTDKLKFDTNPHHYNAVRHPLVGAIDYHVGRTNGMGMIGSMGLAYASGVFWEYFIEFREAPSINDMIMNGAAGLAIGEPFYQFGQLWRGGNVSIADRLRAAAFSPLDAMHDSYRTPDRRLRPRAWRSIELGVGSTGRWFDRRPEGELALVADLDLVSHAAFVREAAHTGKIAPGAWSRIRAGLHAGDQGGGGQVTRTFFHTRTSVAGSYQQTTEGEGLLVALGTAFSYRYDRIGRDVDKLGIAHLIGPQIQLSRRRGATAYRLDLAGYGDFAMLTAQVFGPESPFPLAPPYYTSLQAEGYYYALGLTAMARLRGSTGPWHVDLEVTGHRYWQINGHIDHAPLPAERTLTPTEVSATGVSDTRVFARTKLGYRPSRWGLALTFDGAYRGSSWEDAHRRLTEVSAGVLAELAY